MATIKEKLQKALDNKNNIMRTMESMGIKLPDDMSKWSDILARSGGVRPIELAGYAITTLFSNPQWLDLGVAAMAVDGVEIPPTAVVRPSQGYRTMAIKAITIPELAFCGILYDKISIPASVAYVAQRACADISTLRDVSLYDSTRVEPDAFEGHGDFGTLTYYSIDGSAPADHILDQFIGWDLILNGQHVGNITPSRSGQYYYDNYTTLYFSSDEFLLRKSQMDGLDYLAFYSFSDFSGKQIISVESNRGIEIVSDMELDPNGFYIYPNPAPITWLKVTYI